MSERHFFPMVGRPPCDECGQPEGVVLDVSATGYSVSGGFEHLADCPRLKCRHGVPWRDDCETCNAANCDQQEEP